MTELLENKVCIVTGAGKGIGRSIVKRFYEEGAKLAVITRSNEDLSSLQDELSADDSRLFSVDGDVSNEATCDNFIQNVIKHFGGIDILVNNAGMRFRKEFSSTSLEEFETVFRVNVSSMFMLSQRVLPYMLGKNQGKIINLSSVAGINGLPELNAYVTSKAAIIGFTKSLALEYAEKNIQINAVAPGFCKTSYFDNFKEKSDLYEFTIDRTPMRRWGESREVADVCLFLASELSSYVTGDVITVDGGWSAW